MRLVRLSLQLVHSSNSTLRIHTQYGIPFSRKRSGISSFLSTSLRININIGDFRLIYLNFLSKSLERIHFLFNLHLLVEFAEDLK